MPRKRRGSPHATRPRLPNPVDAVAFDFDGVFTDNGVWVMDDGREAVRCDRGDGLGIGLLRARGVSMLILSKERNPVVSRRAEKLALECMQGIDDKRSALRAWVERNEFRMSHVIYVGNDINDLECMNEVGFAVCPHDAMPAARDAAHLVLSRDGGRGAVRELCDLIVAQFTDQARIARRAPHRPGAARRRQELRSLLRAVRPA